MATDISKVGNAVHFTTTGEPIKAFVGSPAMYYFNAAGTILNVKMGMGGVSGDYSIALTDLTVTGAPPANAAAAYTALSTVFGIYP